MSAAASIALCRINLINFKLVKVDYHFNTTVYISVLFISTPFAEYFGMQRRISRPRYLYPTVLSALAMVEKSTSYCFEHSKMHTSSGCPPHTISPSDVQNTLINSTDLFAKADNMTFYDLTPVACLLCRPVVAFLDSGGPCDLEWLPRLASFLCRRPPGRFSRQYLQIDAGTERHRLQRARLFQSIVGLSLKATCTSR